MNVLLVVPWDQGFGGVASVVENLARHLSRGGHQVLFLHPGDHDRLGRRTTAWGFQGYVLRLRTPFIRERPVMSAVALLEDRPRREALARAGYERALERFTCEATGTRYQQMYSTLVARRGRLCRSCSSAAVAGQHGVTISGRETEFR